MPGIRLPALAGLAAPPRCAACAAAVAPRQPLCARCRLELRATRPAIVTGRPGLDLAVAATEYTGAARSLTLGLKFGRRLALAEVAADLIALACPARELRGTVVPVPAAPWRWRWRGFDPAEEIALALAARTGLPYRDCLRRRGGPRQVGRPRRERLADPPRVGTRPPIPDRALLVDDVRTTGATLAACAGALRSAGSRQVIALTLARSR